MMAMVAFLLGNPFSDLDNPDCSDFSASWNKNLKKIHPHSERPGNLFLLMAGFLRMPLALLSLLEELKWNENLKPVSVTNPNDPRSEVDCLDCNLRLVSP